jgi:hypothetical protein
VVNDIIEAAITVVHTQVDAVHSFHFPFLLEVLGPSTVVTIIPTKERVRCAEREGVAMVKSMRASPPVMLSSKSLQLDHWVR